MRTQSLMQLFESKASLFPTSRESRVQRSALRQIFCSEPDRCGKVSCESLCSENGKAYRCFLKPFYIYGSATCDLSAQMSPPRQHQRQRKTVGKKEMLLFGSWKLLLWPAAVALNPFLQPFSLLLLLLLLRQKDLSRKLMSTNPFTTISGLAAATAAGGWPLYPWGTRDFAISGWKWGPQQHRSRAEWLLEVR